MKPPPFDYAEPETLDEALVLLEDVGEDAVVIAGGQSLVPLLNLRLARPELVVDPRRIEQLATVRDEGDALVVGSMVRVADLMEHPGAGSVPGLLDATGHIAHGQIRARSTVGGCAAHADPAGEIPAYLVAVDGAVELASRRGTRWVAADDFFLGPFMTAREPDELVTAVRFPRYPGNVRVAEVAKQPGDFAIVGAVVGLRAEGDAIVDARVCLFGMAGRPVRMRAVEAALAGLPVGGSTFDRAASLVREIDPLADVHASAEYRREVAATLVCRALEGLA